MTEEQPYDVVQEHPGFELRRYPGHVVAETRVTGSFESVGNTSFRRLVGYIGGRNTQSRKVAMTAPVLQEADTEVGHYVVSFVMPGSRSTGRCASHVSTRRGHRGSCGTTRSSCRSWLPRSEP